MSFLNGMVNKMAMNKMMHEKDMAALAATCQISSHNLACSYSCEDTPSQCFYASCQVGI